MTRARLTYQASFASSRFGMPPTAENSVMTEPKPIEIKEIAAASLDREQVAAFDADLQQLLAERFPEPLSVAHRVFAMVGRAPA